MVNFETNCRSCSKKARSFLLFDDPTTSFFFVVLQITWLDGDGTVIASAEGDDADPSVQQVTEVIENTKRVTTISTLSMTAKKSHHNTNITCQVCITLIQCIHRPDHRCILREKRSSRPISSATFNLKKARIWCMPHSKKDQICDLKNCPFLNEYSSKLYVQVFKSIYRVS